MDVGRSGLVVAHADLREAHGVVERRSAGVADVRVVDGDREVLERAARERDRLAFRSVRRGVQRHRHRTASVEAERRARDGARVEAVERLHEVHVVRRDRLGEVDLDALSDRRPLTRGAPRAGHVAVERLRRAVLREVPDGVAVPRRLDRRALLLDHRARVVAGVREHREPGVGGGLRERLFTCPFRVAVNRRKAVPPLGAPSVRIGDHERRVLISVDELPERGGIVGVRARVEDGTVAVEQTPCAGIDESLTTPRHDELPGGRVGPHDRVG